MSFLRRISERHQVTIPPSLLHAAGIPDGSLVSIAAEAGRIILDPKKVSDQDFDREDWDALERLLRRQVASKAYAQYGSPSDAKKHLRRLQGR